MYELKIYVLPNPNWNSKGLEKWPKKLINPLWAPVKKCLMLKYFHNFETYNQINPSCKDLDAVF